VLDVVTEIRLPVASRRASGSPESPDPLLQHGAIPRGSRSLRRHFSPPAVVDFSHQYRILDGKQILRCYLKPLRGPDEMLQSHMGSTETQSVIGDLAP
jgi:hypothetical protein